MLAASVKEDLRRVRPIALCVYNAASNKFEYLETDQQGNQFGILRIALCPADNDLAIVAGTTIRPVMTGASTNKTQIRSVPSKLLGFEASNMSLTVDCVLNIYNALATNVTVGSTVAYKRYLINKNSTFNCTDPLGIIYSTAITVAVQTLASETDATAVAANSFLLNLSVGVLDAGST